MADDIDRAIAVLEDTSKTWVARRDAADFLGKVAGRALKGLAANQDEDGDRDVQDAVSRALAEANAGLAGAESEAGKVSVAYLARSIEKPGSRDVKEVDGGYEVTVALRDGRSQKVRVTQAKSQAGGDAVRVSTRCGAAAEKALRWALKTNAGFTHCGMTLVEEDGKEWFDLVNAILLETATVDEFTACVKEIAFYGDWAESKLSDGDAF